MIRHAVDRGEARPGAIGTTAGTLSYLNLGNNVLSSADSKRYFIISAALSAAGDLAIFQGGNGDHIHGVVA